MGPQNGAYPEFPDSLSTHLGDEATVTALLLRVRFIADSSALCILSSDEGQTAWEGGGKEE
jgi:hypothetical protein